MGIFARFTLRSLARNRTRTMVSVVGIMLSTALLTAVFTTVTSLEHALLAHTVASEGAWQVFDPAAEEGFEERLLSHDEVSAALASTDLGDAVVSREEDWSMYVNVRTMPRVVAGTEQDALALAQLPDLARDDNLTEGSEGRFPTAAGEICLPSVVRGAVWDGEAEDGVAAAKSDGPIGLGTVVTLPLGRRVDEDGDQLFDTVHGIYGISDGIEDVVTREYVVVGFYQGQYFGQNYFAGTEGAHVGLVADTGEKGVATLCWMATEGVSSRAELKAIADDAFDVDGYYLHATLLNYQGMYGSGPVWDTLWQFAGILAGVILVAAVSLIYNSFAISVAERTRQFGLLSSLGASRRQLRGTVYVEALTLAVFGIPLGIGLGILGVDVTLRHTARAFVEILGLDAAAGETGMPVHVSATALALVAALSAVCVAVSAAIPAVRASRVSAIEGIRQAQDVRLDRATTRRLARAEGAGRQGAEPQGLLGRLFGLPGLLAARNLRRSSSRGRVVVVSLAVSVALLVTAGTIREVMRPLLDVYGNYNGAGSPFDILFGAYPHTDESGIQLHDQEAFLDAVDEMRERLDGVGVDGMTLASGIGCGWTNVVMPARSVSLAQMGGFSWQWGSYDGSEMLTEDGSFAGYASIYFLDDDAWEELAGHAPTGTPEALLLNSYLTNTDDERLASLRPFDDPVTVDAYAFEAREGMTQIGLTAGEDGGWDYYMAPVVVDEYGDGEVGEPVRVGLESAVDHQVIQVVGLLDEEPPELAVVGATAEFPVLVCPASLEGTSEVFYVNRSYLGFSLDDGVDPRRAEQALWDALNEGGSPEGINVYGQNIAEEASSMRAVFDTVNLFVFLFAFITMLIAVANVFNTLSNSIILRTREFAMLQSVGMDAKEFGRMLACECLSYMVRALVVGLGLGAVVAFLLWAALSDSITSTPFPVSVPFVLAAVAGVVCVLGISVAYALRRSHALNVVDALRTDAI